ncbi:enoyl-CoA hydratase/isomerase family protein [Ornithinibacillus halophilus]|uniref:Enoyl-CoA hydratase/carnithine racemase n=1 Tax=Ornithinibacillus halophilus TaxID=930117 RepID=A0A1M5GKH8_9BACI|nr:enoyl-CoA hydratase/isomerase family protein [Ornithinibacillus halophilus]SHG04217.1 Enoyl-CoA hydratase/carnithine racemase [Ornithinibacillus halophilus]
MINPKYINLSFKDKVQIITLNRPDKYNALNTAMLYELKKVITHADESPDINCIVLNGAGKAFCSGADIKEFADVKEDSSAVEERANLSKEIHLLMRQIKKPIIASVHNYVFAGGCGIALACDLVVAADNAKFSYPEVKRGFVPALVTSNLIRIAGPRNAFDLLITGRKVDAKEALSMNLVNHVVPAENLEYETMKLAKQIADQSQTALTMTKELFYQVSELEFEKAMNLGRQVNVRMRKTDDFHKGVEAFVNKN